MSWIFKKHSKRIKRHISSLSSHSIHSRTHFSGPWERRELKESPVHGPLKHISPLKLLPIGRKKLMKAEIYNNDNYLLFYCYHFIYSEELFYGHIAMLVIISEGKANFLIRLLQANRDNRLEITQFKFIKKLGSGSFGTVFLAEHPTRKELVAVKKIIAMRLTKREARDALRIMVEKEASCHIHGSPHVIQLLDTFMISSGAKQAFYFVYEFADGGDLSNLIFRIHYGLVPPELSQLFQRGQWLESVDNNSYIMMFTKYLAPQILMGVGALHERGIIHLDLKPDNIMMTKGGILKITDLGMVKRYRWFHYSARAEFLTSLRREVPDEPNIDKTYIGGTLPYMEPELRGRFIVERNNIPQDLFDYQVTFSADYFSVGMIIFEIMVGFLYGHRTSYDKEDMPVIFEFLERHHNLPLVAEDAYKNFFPTSVENDVREFTRDNLHKLTMGKDEGIVDLLISSCKPRRKRWNKYTIPVKVKRENRKVEENILCVEKIRQQILLFHDVNFEAISSNGVPPDIIRFLDKDTPLYEEFTSVDDAIDGKQDNSEDVYKWPYFGFHLPPEPYNNYENIELEKEHKNLTPEEFEIFRDDTVRSLRPHKNGIVETNFIQGNKKDKKINRNLEVIPEDDLVTENVHDFFAPLSYY